MHEHEQAAAAADQVVEQTFLSPRVVDAATLAEFGESLSELLRRAAEQRELLRLTVTEGENVSATLRDTTGQAAEKLRPALKLLPTIEQKLAQADQAVTRATHAAETAERAAGRAAQAAADEGVAALQAAQRALDAAMERARTLEGRLGQLSQRAEAALLRLDSECKSRLDTAAKHAQDVLGSLVAELDSHAERTLEHLSGLIDERRAAAEAALAEPLSVGAPHEGDPDPRPPTDATTIATTTTAPADDATGLLARAEETRAAIEAMFASLRSRAGEEIASLEAEAVDAEQRAAAATAKVHETEELARAAEARLEAVHRELTAVDERGREIAVMATHALTAFDEELAARMHAVREMMEQLASVTNGQAEAKPAPAQSGPIQSAPAHAAPAQSAEVKPAREAAFIRIDRPAQSDTPGLPGRLQI
jgi:hypothetical protein